MASWMIHLRVAQGIYRQLGLKHIDEFIMGNIAPDSGIPTADGTGYQPDAEVSHFRTIDQNGIKDVHEERFEERVLCALEEHRIDMAVLAGFLGILSADFIARFGGPIINIHPSLIPSFCGKGFYGLRVHQAALDCGVKITGATVHYVNEVPDGGKIILQKAVEVRPGDTAETLQRRVMREAEWKLLPQAAELAARELTGGAAE